MDYPSWTWTQFGGVVPVPALPFVHGLHPLGPVGADVRHDRPAGGDNDERDRHRVPGHRAWTDAVLPDEPFMVKASSADRSGLYEREHDVVAQFRPGEAHARFEAEWTDEGWKFGRRIADA